MCGGLVDTVIVKVKLLPVKNRKKLDKINIWLNFRMILKSNGMKNENKRILYN